MSSRRIRPATSSLSFSATASALLHSKILDNTLLCGALLLNGAGIGVFKAKEKGWAIGVIKKESACRLLFLLLCNGRGSLLHSEILDNTLLCGALLHDALLNIADIGVFEEKEKGWIRPESKEDATRTTAVDSGSRICEEKKGWIRPVKYYTSKINSENERESSIGKKDRRVLVNGSRFIVIYNVKNSFCTCTNFSTLTSRF